MIIPTLVVQYLRRETTSSWPRNGKQENNISIAFELHINGLMQERRNSNVNALDLLLFWTNPSIWKTILWNGFYHWIKTEEMLTNSILFHSQTNWHVYRKPIHGGTSCQTRAANIGYWYIQWVATILRCHPASRGIPMIKIRWSKDHLIFIMGILHLEKWSLYWNKTPNPTM